MTYRQQLARRQTFQTVSAAESAWPRGQFLNANQQNVSNVSMPEGFFHTAHDVILGEGDTINRRGGTVTAQTSLSALVPDQGSLALFKSTSADALFYGLFSAAGSWVRFDPTAATSALTALSPMIVSTGSANAYAIPQQYLNTLSVTQGDVNAPGSGYGLFQTWGGATSKTTATALAASTLTQTAGSPVLTGLNAGDVAKCEPGMFIVMSQIATIETYAMYRITAVGAATLTVEPTPVDTYATVNPKVYMTMGPGAPTGYGLAAGYSDDNVLTTHWDTAAVYQNRFCMGGVTLQTNLGTTMTMPYRFCWSLLPDETYDIPAAALFVGSPEIKLKGLYPIIYQAIHGITGGSYYNYIDLPDLRRITGVVPLSDDRILVLGSNGAVVITGFLESQNQLVTHTPTYSVRNIDHLHGCSSRHTVQRTQYGAMWASPEGVMLHDGSALRNLMLDSADEYWQSQYSGSPAISFYGSAVLHNNYYAIAYTSGGLKSTLLVKLDSPHFPWTQHQNIEFNGSALDPVSGYKCYATHAADGGGNSKGKLYYLDQIVNIQQLSTSATDADGSTPSGLFSTRPYTFGDPGVLKRFKHVYTYHHATGTTSNCTVRIAGLNLHGTIIWSELLPNNLTLANIGMNRQEPTTMNIAETVQFTFTGSAALTSFEVKYLKIVGRRLKEARLT